MRPILSLVLSVSYTHLDVYKRQKYALPGGARANVTYTITGDGKVEAALKWKGKAVESVPEFGLMLTLPAEMCIRDSVGGDTEHAA